jgi:serine/threonine protein kinase
MKTRRKRKTVGNSLHFNKIKSTSSTYKNGSQSKNKKGGKVLASGGYGCVFEPALKCLGQTKRDPNKISKLMTEKYAQQEYDEIQSIKDKLDSIDNYTDYFLLYDATICKPAKLTTADLTEFTSKCTALPKNKITKANINSHLDDLMSLNMPHGGKPVDDYIYENGTFMKLYQVNDVMMKLLKKGILEMNKKHIFHNDIKDSNILIDSSNPDELKARLIDWGLSTHYTPFKKHPFPKSWRNRPLQYNVPFSVILFTDTFVKKYADFIKEGNDYKKEAILKPFVIDYYNEWNKERGAGHYKFINELFLLLYKNSMDSVSPSKKPQLIETEFVLTSIIDYLVQILIKHTKLNEDGSVNMREYLDNVFIHNVDIWGFINAYFPMLELLSNNYKTLADKELELFEYVKGLFVNYLYANGDEIIDVESLYTDLKEIKDILHTLAYNKPRSIQTDAKSSALITRINTSSTTKKSKKSNTHKKSKTSAASITSYKSSGSLFNKKHRKNNFTNPFFLSL